MTVKGKGDYFWIWGSEVLNLDFLTILCTHTHTHTHTHFFGFTAACLFDYTVYTHTHTHTHIFGFTAACGILVPQPGIELMLSAVEAQS